MPGTIDKKYILLQGESYPLNIPDKSWQTYPHRNFTALSQKGIELRVYIVQNKEDITRVTSLRSIR